MFKRVHLYLDTEPISIVTGSLGQQVLADALEVVVGAVEGGDVRIAPRCAHCGARALAALPLAALALAKQRFMSQSIIYHIKSFR